MADYSPDKKSGCVAMIYGGLFRQRCFWPRRSASTSSIPTHGNNGIQSINSKRRRGSDERAFLDDTNLSEYPQRNDQSPMMNVATKTPPPSYQEHGRKVSNAPIVNSKVGLSNDHQSNGLVRASSSNVMLFGNLGNLRQPAGHGTSNPRAMGNEEYKQGNFAEALAFYDRAIGLDPDMASYRSNKSAALTGLGRLLEAVFECREAIKIDPTYRRAHYRLATLCLRLGEAEKSLYHYKQSGHEADPSDISKAKNLQIYLSKCTEARKLRDWQTVIKESSSAISSGADSALQVFALKAESLLKLHRHEDADAELSKAPRFGIDDCTKFFGPVGNANLLVTRAQVDVALGRFEEAVATAQRAAQLDSTNKDVNSTLRKAQALASARSNGNELFKASKFLDACVAYSEGLEQDFFNSVLLCNRAACRSKLGQFEKAVEDCSKALNVRPSYSKARLRRADCNAKLGRWEASAQDYEILRNKMPSDEEVARGLLEAQAHLKKSHSEQRQTQPDGHHSKNAKSDSNLAVVKDADHFRHFVTSPGPGIFEGDGLVLEVHKTLKPDFCSLRSLLNSGTVLEKCSSRVEVEEHPILAKSEGVNSIPVFRMYKNGSRIKEIPRTSLELLESTVKFYTKS
ncbi:hypothetical protein C5167_028163 [Papaver somniferum]|nr:hypothetical protein C5167_028163 [Papaver somniferum]